MNTKFVVGGNSTGKTRALLEFAKEKNALVICKNPAAMLRKAEAYGIFGLQFCSYGDAVLSVHETGTIDHPGNFVIDEVKNFLDFVTASNCVGFTQTEDF